MRHIETGKFITTVYYGGESKRFWSRKKALDFFYSLKEKKVIMVLGESK